MSKSSVSIEYVWEWPVRIVHWTNVVSLLVLSFSGIYMGVPFIQASSFEVMKWMQFFHFLFGYILTLSLAVRIVWFFKGNPYAHWRTLFPFTQKQRKDFKGALYYYLFLKKEYPKEMGHTYLAVLAYAGIFFLIFIQCVTGFSLYFMDRESKTLFWVISFYGGVGMTKLIHHSILWIFVCFFIHHLYSSILIDLEEKNGLISSIFTGYKSKQ